MTKQNTYRLRTVICTLAVVCGLLMVFGSGVIRTLMPETSAAPATFLNFQARLRSSSGAVVPDGNYNIEFKLYDHASAGNLLWTETRTGVNRVRVVNGYFSVSLGSVTAFPGTINWSEEKWITMNIGGTGGSPSWDGEMTNAGNRMILTAVPYAFQADRANSLTDGTNNYTANDFIRVAPGATQGTNSSGAAVRINQTGAGGLLQLQSGGSDMLTLSNSGDLALAGNLEVAEDVAVKGGSLVVGDDSQQAVITLHDGAGHMASIQAYGDTGSALSFKADGHSMGYIADFWDCCNLVLSIGGTGRATYFREGVEIDGLGLYTDNISSLDGSSISIGAPDTTGTLLVLDTKTDAGDPTGTNGAMYYNADAGKFRCYENDEWKDCISVAGSVTPSTATYVVAANDSPAHIKASADYVADGTSDEDEINTALTAGAGGKIHLAEGTFVVDGTILVPNNTTLEGTGKGTIIEFADIDATDNMIENSDTSTGTGITIRNLALDGRSDLNTSGSQTGIYLNGVGNNVWGVTDRLGATISDLYVSRFSTAGVNIASSNSIITNNEFANTGRAVYVTGGTFNNITNNIIDGGPYAIYIQDSDYNTVYFNNVKDSQRGIYLNNADLNEVSNNKTHATGQSQQFRGVVIGGTSQNNRITNNYLTDTSCSVACYAIEIASTATGTHLEGNRFSGGTGATIDDQGTSTTYTNQQTNSSDSTDRQLSEWRWRGSSNSSTAFQVQNASGTDVLTVDTSTPGLLVGGSLSVSAGASISGAAINLNVSSNYDTNINTGTSTGSVTIGNAGAGNVELYSGGSIRLYGNGDDTTAGLSVSSIISIGRSTIQFTNSTGTKTIKTADTANSQSLAIRTGDASANAGVSGDITIVTGAGEGTNTSTGNITIDAGTAAGSGTAGAISIGATNASAVILGHDGIDVTVGGNLVIGTSDTTGTLLVLDTKTNAGDPTGVNGAMYYNSNSGKFRCYEGGAWKDCVTPGNTAGTRVARMIPEFEGMVMRGDGSNNIGYLTADFCSGSSRMNINASACGSTQTYNYYNWTTAEASAQDYDMYVRWRVPDDYTASSVPSSVTVHGWRTDSTNNAINVRIYNANGAQCGSTTQVAGNGSWAGTAVSSVSGSNCQFSPGEYITFQITLAADTNDSVRLGQIEIGYTSSF